MWPEWQFHLKEILYVISIKGNVIRVTRLMLLQNQSMFDDR